MSFSKFRNYMNFFASQREMKDVRKGEKRGGRGSGRDRKRREKEREVEKPGLNQHLKILKTYKPKDGSQLLITHPNLI